MGPTVGWNSLLIEPFWPKLCSNGSKKGWIRLWPAGLNWHFGAETDLFNLQCIDKDLSYKEHISDQLKKAYRKASALRRIKRYLPLDAIIKLYKAFMLPHLEYCSPLFVSIGTGQRNRLEGGNCYILRTLIGHKKSMSYDELLTTASMTSLYCRHLHQALLNTSF